MIKSNKGTEKFLF